MVLFALSLPLLSLAGEEGGMSGKSLLSKRFDEWKRSSEGISDYSLRRSDYKTSLYRTANLLCLFERRKNEPQDPV